MAHSTSDDQADHGTILGVYTELPTDTACIYAAKLTKAIIMNQYSNQNNVAALVHGVCDLKKCTEASIYMSPKSSTPLTDIMAELVAQAENTRTAIIIGCDTNSIIPYGTVPIQTI